MSYDVRFLFAAIIFLVAYVAIALRNTRGKGLPVWLMMLAGAIGMVFSVVIGVEVTVVNIAVLFFFLALPLFLSGLR